MSTEAATQEDAHLRTLGANARHVKHNHRLGLAAGVFSGMAQDFLQPELIMGGLIYELTHSTMLVALIPLLNKLGSLAPPLLASNFLEHRNLRRPAFIAVAVLRIAAHAAMIAAMLLLTRQVTGFALALFYTAYFFVSVCAGTSYIIFMDMTGRLIPPDRVGSFLGMRSFIGGGLAIACGILVIQPILASVALPMNYLVLAVIGTVLVAGDHTIWSMCRESPGPSADRPTTLVESLQRGFRWLKADHDYRCYLLLRIAFRINYLGVVFTIPYGSKCLGYDSDTASLAMLGGILVASRKLSAVVSSAVWGRIADRFGSRMTLIGAGVCLVVAPLLALLAPLMPKAFEIPLPGVDRGMDLPLAVFILSLIAFQAGLRGDMLGGHRFLITRAPPHRRASYVSFLNAITSPLALLPLVGALMAETIGMTWLFVAITGGGVLSVIGALRMSRHT